MLSVAGEISVLSDLDRESCQLYILNVSASDLGIRPGPLHGYTVVNVTVDDFNDHPPEFDRGSLLLSVAENVQPPATVGHVMVTDADHGESARVTCVLNSTGTASVVLYSLSWGAAPVQRDT